jgi:hypothetical protein
MGESPFRFLDEDEFKKLDQRARLAYLVRAQQELIARQDLLRAQRKLVLGDPEATLPVSTPEADDERADSGQN